MNKKQRNKLHMYKVVLSVCEEESELVSAVPAFTQAIGDLKITTEEIERMMSAQTARRSGTTNALNNLKTDLIRQNAIISSALFVYATNSKNYPLRDKTNYTTSDLSRMSHAGRIASCTRLLEEIRSSDNLIAEAKLSEEEVVKLETQLKEYKNLYTKPRELVVGNAVNTVELKAAFKLGDLILNEQTDRLVVFFREKNPTFHTKYRNARKIEDRGMRHSTPNETDPAVDTDNGQMQ